MYSSPPTRLCWRRTTTLLVVVDTNRPDQVVAEQLLLSCNKVAVIDHHRRSAKHIENAALNYHEPYASSACELVTELLQYLLDSTDLLRGEAEALLAGIVLDTKSFTLRTGGRTFEAAAFLPPLRRGHRGGQAAVPEQFVRHHRKVRHHLQRPHIQKRHCHRRHQPHRRRVTAAQAADELLNVAGTAASFVLFPDDESRIYISGRSIGDVNVQVILETLGGGGNAAAAAAQIPDGDVNKVLQQLLGAIDEYFKDEE